ncbi:MAG TPA: Rrf2 family transcriptional regulator [Mycobacteriales bacterium]|nr:Rrf2 family transcriptional regulator [Mycobacteriales bacterium]
MALFDQGSVHISAKTDYAVRAVVELASAGTPGWLAAPAIADAQHIPLRFLLNILADLRRLGLVDSRRGPSGGWSLSIPAAELSVADVIRAVDGPLTRTITRPVAAEPGSINASVDAMWGAVQIRIRDVLEQISVADLASGSVPTDTTTSAPRQRVGSSRIGSARGSGARVADASEMTG